VFVSTQTPLDADPQRYVLSAVRQSQAAVIDGIRTWTTITEQLTRPLRQPFPRVDLAGLVDRAFDVAEQTLAAQRKLAQTLAGVATRQVDTATEAVETAVAAVEAPEAEQAQRILERPQQPQAESPKQDRRPDGRTYEERSLEELRERAAELQIEGRSTMTKDELIAALRNQRKRSAKSDAPESQPSQQDRRPYEDRSIEELRERGRELEIEGRSTMSKEELIAALRERSR
jgi:hypothetical protein